VVKKKEQTSSVGDWIKSKKFKTTADIEIPELLMAQVIGQDETTAVMKKAAEQKRHVMMIGDPGTGKSMLAQAMAELLTDEELEDTIIYSNPEDLNKPKVRVVPAGKGEEIVRAKREQARKAEERKSSMIWMLMLLVMGATVIFFIMGGYNFMILFFGAMMCFMILMASRYIGQRKATNIPKLLVWHSRDDKPSFIDATGTHEGALLGDVRHDPYQSGGLETPAHERVEAGAIHRAHRGVLFVDEIGTLDMESQQHLLSAMQEKKFSITGRSERSSGALVQSEPVPCDFILVAAGNLHTLQGIHPALRSRIRGYGYEVYVRSTMEDNNENREKLIRLVAQEVTKDGKIPHFDKAAVAQIIKEGQRRSGRKGHLTLRLRELGGLVRVAGDVAVERGAEFVTEDDVLRAKTMARSLEKQVADRYLETRKGYEMFKVSGEEVGMVNGLAVMGAGEDSGDVDYSGTVLPIVAEVTPAQSRNEGKIIATGKLGEIAKEAVENVAALIKKFTGKDISNHDVHIQFIGTYGGTEGDSASVSIATAVISALEAVPVDQSVAMTGSLSVRGKILPVGGVSAKIEAAADAGIYRIIIPKANMEDVLLDPKYEDKVEIVPVESIEDVLEYVLSGPMKEGLLKKIRRAAKSIPAPKAGKPEPSRS